MAGSQPRAALPAFRGASLSRQQHIAAHNLFTRLQMLRRLPHAPGASANNWQCVAAAEERYGQRGDAETANARDRVGGTTKRGG